MAKTQQMKSVLKKFNIDSISAYSFVEYIIVKVTVLLFPSLSIDHPFYEKAVYSSFRNNL